MKKIMFMLALIAGVFSASAACANWKYVGAEADENSAVYALLGDVATTSFESLAQITENGNLLGGGSIGTIAKLGSGTRASYTGSGTINDAKLTANANQFYFVIVNSDQSGFFVSSVQSANIYNEGETAGAATTITNKNMTYTAFKSDPGPGPTPVDTPEPTSGLLLLVGGAALALRRKQK